MLVTVLIPAYNAEATILEILRKVRRQAMAALELEIVVVEDGSKERTRALLEANPDVYHALVKQPKNGGEGVAVRAGLTAATDKYIPFQEAAERQG